MSNYVKQTWTDGVSALSAARMGVIENGIFDAHFQPGCRTGHSANQSLTNSTNTVIAFDTERWDTDTIHDNVTNNSRLTCKTAGKYQISACIAYASNATGDRETSIRLNGTTVIAYDTRSAVNGAVTIATISTLWDMAVNDYVEVLGFQTSGGALNVTTNAAYSPEFMMVRVA